jgi:hypothetical protein
MYKKMKLKLTAEKIKVCIYSRKRAYFKIVINLGEKAQGNVSYKLYL